ncbi:hypothetical protein E4U60_007182 [Claviceps pazoutovae]|uniref:Uncharacterized protein n=1 Tax=Claviceps pazoutovae TaxID=1649127 RepID=A0A9P7MEX8_9HYPO|nr:hypothetical protein E4U60_007182 [Claviceps pazoutovae]
MARSLWELWKISFPESLESESESEDPSLSERSASSQPTYLLRIVVSDGHSMIFWRSGKVTLGSYAGWDDADLSLDEGSSDSDSDSYDSGN